ncbi:MAG: DUF1828 domain-containing protein [Bacteroidales bacterium]|jgi:hypothetical protein|nr:DUF1828 domain-containing protein [Bacteroidales bacterium]
MNELYKAISELTFASFCSEITRQDDATLEFKIKHRFHGNRKEEVFVLQKTEDGLFVSDNGSTLANLDNTFNLSEPETVTNLMKISLQFNIRKTGNEFRSGIDLSKEVSPQIIRFLQGIHFMYTMILFYK